MSQLTVLVRKLGHGLEEIRARALNNIVSKLDYKLITEDELVDKDCIFQNLVKWFQFKNAPAKEDVLKLIIRLLKHGGDDAVALLLRADPGLSQLREVTDCDVLVQDIVNLTSAQVNSARYARSNGALDSARTTKATSTERHARSNGMPDSARSTKVTSTQLNLEHHARNSGMPDSARTTNLRSVRSSKTADSSNEPKSARLRTEQFVQKYKELPLYNPNEASSLGFSTNKIEPTPTQPEEESSGGVLWSLPSVSLVASDLNVISAVEDSLKLLASVTHTCHFFSSVIIRDFPPEVFLQHPGVIRQLLRLTKKSAPVNAAAVECLAVYTRQLLKQLVFSSQLQYTSLKFQSDAQGNDDFTDSSARSSKRPVETSLEVMQKYLEEGYLSSGSDHQTCAADKSPDVLTIPQYCLETLVAAVELVGRIPQASSLVLRALSLLQASVPDPRSLWQHLHVQLHHLLRTLLATITQQIKLSVSQGAVVELHVTVCWLRVLDTLVPPQLAPSVLPTELQDLVCEALLSPVLAINYTKLHTTCVTYATVLQRKGTQVYEEVSVVVDAMQASGRFSREAPNMPPLQALETFRDAIPALPYNQDLSIIKEFTQYLMERRDLCEEEIDLAAQLTRSLLAHSEKVISVETYRVLHDIVALMLGPRQVLSNVDPCPRLSFLINTPVLVEITCHGVTSSDNQVRQNAEDILLLLLKCQMLVSDDSWQRLVEQLTPVLPLLQCHASKGSPLGRGALHMLDPDMASTIGLSHLQVLLGNARLLLHKEPLCREEAATRLLWLAKLHHLPHKRLADVCVLDVAITAHTPVTGMYEVGSVVRVLEVLSSSCVEARVKQSALTQLSVMTEDSRLHQVFIEELGVELFISILKNVMEDMNEDASSYIIPIIATLKHLARHNSTIRQSLTHDGQFVMCLLKSLFQVSEWRLQRDATQLLTLLLYSDYVLSSAVAVSLPQLVVQSLCLPFACQTHWTVSPHTTSTQRGVVLGYKSAERLLAVQWAVLKQGLDSVLRLTDIPPPQGPLPLTLRTVRQVQHTHVEHNCRLLLYAFQNATSHEVASRTIKALVCYLELSWMVEPEVLSALPWKETFRKFLLRPPSGQDDFALLLLVFQFLLFLLDVCPGQNVWITEALQTKPYTVLQLIVTADSSHVNDDQEMWKSVSLYLLELCKMCSKQGSTSGWQIVVQLILQCVEAPHSSSNQNFFNLVSLNGKLECLLATLTGQTADCGPLWRLLAAFHCHSAQTFMGLSVARLTVLCLNKLLSLTQDWEHRWLSEPHLCYLPTLCASRDVVVRASTLQLLAGLSRSVRGAGTVLQLSPGLFECILRVVVDHSEASFVREHAALLLANIVKNSSSKELAVSARKLNLYQEFRDSVSLVSLTSPSTHTEASSGMLYTHPRFIRAGCWLVNNLMASAPDDMLQLVVSSGLADAMCRILVDIEKLDDYDLVTMFGAVCKLLSHCVRGCEPAQLQDILPSLMCLLDPACLVQDSDQVDRGVKVLWRQVLRLLSVVLPCAEAQLVLTQPAVNTLCQCISGEGCGTLKASALQAVPSLAKHLTPRAEVEVCEALVNQWQCRGAGGGSAVLPALTALLGHSPPATQTALQCGLLDSVVSALRQVHLSLLVQTSSTDKLKKNNPLVNEMSSYLNLLTSFLYSSDNVRLAAAQLGLADLVHKVWLWCQVDPQYLLMALDLLITFTANCPEAAQTLVLTSTLSGVGQRKAPTSHSLVHALISLLARERQPPSVRARALTLLSHCCQAHECRAVIAKNGLLAYWSDLWADRRQPQEETEVLWLRFILTFTSSVEGQTSVPKTGELFSQLVQCAESGRSSSRPLALAVIRNLASLPANRPRFLTTKPVLTMVGEKLLTGSPEEKRDAALITWALAGNHQKAKVALRGLGLVGRLQLAAATSEEEIFSFVSELLQAR